MRASLGPVTERSWRLSTKFLSRADVARPDLPWRGRRAFYKFHSSLMEPWDGPAAVVWVYEVIAGICFELEADLVLRLGHR